MVHVPGEPVRAQTLVMPTMDLVAGIGWGSGIVPASVTCAVRDGASNSGRVCSCLASAPWISRRWRKLLS